MGLGQMSADFNSAYKVSGRPHEMSRPTIRKGGDKAAITLDWIAGTKDPHMKSQIYKLYQRSYLHDSPYKNPARKELKEVSQTSHFINLKECYHYKFSVAGVNDCGIGEVSNEIEYAVPGKPR